MAELKDKAETALNEARILVLGVQVLTGFQFQVVFEPGFDKLSDAARYLHLIGLAFLLLTLACLMSPAPFHRLVLHGNLAPTLLSYTTRAVGISLLPLSLSLTLDFYLATERLGGLRLGLLAAALALGLPVLFWYVWEWVDRSRLKSHVVRQEAMSHTSAAPAGGTPLAEKVKQVMTETRIVLPGVQALLAFQFMNFFLDAFEKLPVLLKYVHLCGLGLMGVSMVLLMTPAAYHRLVERGEDSERFHQLASRLLLAAMVFLALGMAADVWVVVEKVSQSRAAGLLGAGGALVLFYGVWFGYTWYRRSQTQAVGVLEN